MTKPQKFAVKLFGILIGISLIVYFIQNKIQKDCKRRYTICYINNFKKSIVSRLYADFYFKIGKLLTEEKNVVVDDIFTDVKGKNTVTKEGYYFMDYCNERTQLRTVYTEILPLDVNLTFLDSSWATFEEMKLYAYSKAKREEIIKHNEEHNAKH